MESPGDAACKLFSAAEGEEEPVPLTEEPDEQPAETSTVIASHRAGWRGNPFPKAPVFHFAEKG